MSPHTLFPLSMCRLADLQAAVLAIPSLVELVVHGSGGFSAAAAASLLGVLGRPGLRVDWRAASSIPSLLLARDCGPPCSDLRPAVMPQ